jgi:hypothetical protein
LKDYSHSVQLTKVINFNYKLNIMPNTILS